jgi:hypothetical protein
MSNNLMSKLNKTKIHMGIIGKFMAILTGEDLTAVLITTLILLRNPAAVPRNHSTRKPAAMISAD